MEPMKKQVLIFAIAVILVTGAIVAVLSIGDMKESNFKYTEEEESGGGVFLSEESVESWIQYDGEVQEEELELFSPDLEPLSESELNEIKSGIANGTYSSEGPSSGAGEGATILGEEAKGSDDRDSDGEWKRAVEEGDIVKLSGDHLYILSCYRGFVVVDVSDPEDLKVVSYLNLKGHPVEMYVHEPLAVVVLYGNYYRGPSTLVAVLNLKDEGNIRVVKYITVAGQASVSRLVGDTLYIATLLYPYYYPIYAMDVREGEVALGGGEVEGEGVGYYKEPEREVLISSIDLSSPERLGVVDNLTLGGESVQVHAISDAIFVATGYFHWDERGEDFIERTTVHYVDISDKSGEIKLRGSITFEGSLWDKYQMDYYGGTLRVITHRRSWRGDGTSYLKIIDVRNPDRLKVIGSLAVDEAGNLMAVRFSEKRLYLIHLPHAPDPLRIVDLSDPTQPELKSVLEIPGWVEHMEVIGNHIVAVGVNDTEGIRVSIYLFDVTDPENPVLQDTITIGEGYSTSEALWEPKAITLLKERSLLIIPYREHYWPSEGGKGLLFVKYSTEEGELSLWGKVNSPDVLRRSRTVGEYILGTSERLCISVDISGDTPRLADVLPITENYYDLLKLSGGVGALVEVLGEHYFRYMPRGEPPLQISLPVNSSVKWWGVKAFSAGDRVLLICSPTYYRYYIYEMSGEESPPPTTIVLIEIVEGVPQVSDTAELSAPISRMLELGDGRVLLREDPYRYYPVYKESEPRDEDDEEGEPSDKGGGEAGGLTVYLVNYTSGEIVVEEYELDIGLYETLCPLKSGLYSVEVDRSRGSDYASRVYYVDLLSGNKTSVGTMKGWVLTWDGDRIVTMSWVDESYWVNIYAVSPTSVEREAALPLPFWGDVRIREDDLYILNCYYPYVYWDPDSDGAGSEYTGPRTAIVKMDITTGEVLDAVKVKGSFWVRDITEEWLLLLGYDRGTSVVGALKTANLTDHYFSSVQSPPIDVVADGGVLHIALGEFGYAVVALEEGA